MSYTIQFYRNKPLIINFLIKNNGYITRLKDLDFNEIIVDIFDNSDNHILYSLNKNQVKYNSGYYYITIPSEITKFIDGYMKVKISLCNDINNTEAVTKQSLNIYFKDKN